MGDVDQWANLHPYMLIEITKRFYSYDNDYIQLRLVCKQWNLKLPKIPNGNKVTWLLLPIGDGAAKESLGASTLEEDDIYHIMQLPTIDEETLDLRNLEEKGIYHLLLPELQHNLISGSCCGWLIIVMIYEGIIRILNPFTKDHLDLPPISTLPNVINISGNKCTVDYGVIITDLDIIRMHKIQAWKVIINSAPNNANSIDNDFIAVIIYGIDRELAFYKPNDKRWIRFPAKHMNIHDVIFFQEKIYAIDVNRQLYEFDTETKSGAVGGISEVAPPSLDAIKTINHNYLIGCANGSLLMLARHIRYRRGKKRIYYCETLKFDIYELKKNEKAWSRIYSLGNYVLVIGLNSSIQILSSNFLNGKRNQIYFTDDHVEEHSEKFASRHNIGIFNLEDGCCQTMLSDVNFFCPPVWILP